MSRFMITAVAVLFVSACSSGNPTEPPGNGGGNGGGGNGGGGNGGGGSSRTVTLNPLTFSPATLTINTGETVNWVNDSAILHTITPQGHSQWNRVETSATGTVLTVTFATAGNFPYTCEVHAGMNGTIVVQ